MNFFDRHKALIITVLLFMVILLGMYNIRLYNNNSEVNEMLVQLSELSEETPEEKQQREPEKPQPKPPSSVETHRAFNTNTEESQEEFEKRLDEIFQENSADREESQEEVSTGGSVNIGQKNKEDQKERSDGSNESQEISTRTGSMRNSSISFSLLGRNAIDIPNPIYTCDTRGKIVVNITVNAQGSVTETSINTASSSSTNECLLNQALKYAADAIFSELPGRDAQPGTITYNFQD